MSRLTKKGTRMVNGFREYDWYNKLGKFEDLEDELGCPLEVVFKALKDNEIQLEFQGNIIVDDGIALCYDGKWFLITSKGYIRYLSYYGITWWLNENEVEE